jgi:hypothetical protein
MAGFLHDSAATHPRSFWTHRPHIRPCDQTAEEASINGKYSAAAAAAPTDRPARARRSGFAGQWGPVGIGRVRRGSVAVARNCWDFRADGRNRSTVVGGAGPAARILNLSPNATNGAICATRREAGATGFDCGAGGAAGSGAVALWRWLCRYLVTARGIESLVLRAALSRGTVRLQRRTRRHDDIPSTDASGPQHPT